MFRHNLLVGMWSKHYQANQIQVPRESHANVQTRECPLCLPDYRHDCMDCRHPDTEQTQQSSVTLLCSCKAWQYSMSALSRNIFFSFLMTPTGSCVHTASTVNHSSSPILDYERSARSRSQFCGSQPTGDLVINLVIGCRCRYFPLGPQLLSQSKGSPLLAGTKLYCLVT